MVMMTGLPFYLPNVLAVELIEPVVATPPVDFQRIVVDKIMAAEEAKERRYGIREAPGG